MRRKQMQIKVQCSVFGGGVVLLVTMVLDDVRQMKEEGSSRLQNGGALSSVAFRVQAGDLEGPLSICPR
jgi:hypothetical protein